jgi:hypothetical protein
MENLDQFQQTAINQFRTTLFSSKEDLEKGFREGNGRTALNITLGSEFLGLDDYVGKIIQEFIFIEIRHLCILDEYGEAENLEVHQKWNPNRQLEINIIFKR